MTEEYKIIPRDVINFDNKEIREALMRGYF